MESKALAEFIAQLTYDQLDDATIDYTKMCILDLIGVAIAGSATPTGKLWYEYLSASQRKCTLSEATCLNHRLEMGEYRAVASYNAACAHLMDLDDLHNSSIAHLGAVTIPAALAVGQLLGCSGKALLTAIVAGYEAGARIGEAINPGAYWFWHTTGVVGSLSSAMAVSKLLQLEKEQVLDALGSAGTQSAGLWEFIENGSMSKSLHTANATLCGIRAAFLAQLGFTGAHTILEGRRGLIKALNPQGDVVAITRGLGKGYKIRTNSFKPYACCRHTHASNACAQWLRQTYAIDPVHIRQIVDRTYRLAIDLADNAHPSTPYAYKFSIQYCIAAMLLYGELTEEVFSPAWVTRPEVQALMAKVHVQEDPELQRDFLKNANQWSHLLEIQMDDGQIYRCRVDFPPGDFMNPFQWRDAEEKYFRITKGVISSAQAQSIRQAVGNLEDLEDVNALFISPDDKSEGLS